MGRLRRWRKLQTYLGRMLNGITSSSKNECLVWFDSPLEYALRLGRDILNFVHSLSPIVDKFFK